MFESHSISISSSAISRLGVPSVSPCSHSSVVCSRRYTAEAGNSSAKRSSAMSTASARTRVSRASRASRMMLGLTCCAVAVHHQVRDLVDQAHGVDLPSLDRLLGEVDQIALVVHALREDARGVEVGEDDVAGQLEEGLVELVAVARIAGNVELKRSCTTAFAFSIIQQIHLAPDTAFKRLNASHALHHCLQDGDHLLLDRATCGAAVPSAFTNYIISGNSERGRWRTGDRTRTTV